ncbi:serine hydroxymethyltransferase [Amycolatopsis sp. 195334CR]|uniref:serine hydroxymethyltransferase n=1 Tax=Amycolatopsis sp. 195334CR TaxID=2814588 RepID=UPI001A8DF9ED|nr:serine hydroxymethyltransferase [Amycolatopsis sp. 195334CR]MBN6042089.1 serine hydroxymethyltransferase [Amycolatopsis sp. 195334CR]
MTIDATDRRIGAAGLVETIRAEHEYQRETLCLIAARSIVHPRVAAATQSVFANITTEGYPGDRYHSGSAGADVVERMAVDSACAVFGAAYANVQSHAASTANLTVLTALLAPGDVVLSMDLASGGHLTHVSRPSVTGRFFRGVYYGVRADGRIDLAEVDELAARHRPKMIICGGSGYTRGIDFAGFRRIADRHGCVLVADISHTAGLVAAGLYPSPVPHVHVTTLCTHKQLYGPKGGLILSGPDALVPPPGRTEPLAKILDRAVFPYFQGSPDFGAIAGKACVLDWVRTAEFHRLMRRVRELADLLARRLERGFDLVSGGTDSHMVLVDLRSRGITGRDAERALEAAGILANRNRVPGDTTPARVAAGLRVGTNIAAYRGMTTADFDRCCTGIVDVLENPAAVPGVRAEIAEVMSRYPLEGAL